MKLLFSFCAVVAAIGLGTMDAQAIEVAELSLLPGQACKAPPKAPPGKLLSKGYYGNFSTGSNAPFVHDVDINGDGWCDWISIAAQPPHREGVEWGQPLMKDFIFLGQKAGWRYFGNKKPIRAFIAEHKFGEPYPYDGDSEVTHFVSPMFIYTQGDLRPYVSAISIAQDVLDATEEDVMVYRWNDAFDTLLDVNDHDRSVVIRFLRMQFCGKKESLPLRSVPEAVCRTPPP
jgi:hypothetical protein